MKFRLVCVAMAVAGLSSGGALAADLGGNCCADLEERIAELEATTARKGNRKVSLTISGWVNESVTWWDDGKESNVYVGTNSLEQDRFKFSGDAKIADGWSAGYTLEVGVWGSASKGTDADTPTGTDSVNKTVDGLVVRKSSWFLKSKELGKVTVGQDGMATYHLLDDADGVNTRNFSDAEAAAVAMANFVNQGDANGKKYKDLLGGWNGNTPGQGARRNVVRYDSPEFQGFVLSASWGEDDVWDVAGTFKKEIENFKVVARVGYGESTSPGGDGIGACKAKAGVTNGDCQWYGAAATIMEKTTGLYVYGGYGVNELNLDAGVAGDDKSTMWFIQAGIEQKFFGLGKTTLFGEYRSDEAGHTQSVFSSNIENYAGGVVQHIDAAEMDLYAIYRHTQGDYNTDAVTNFDIQDFDTVITGAFIRF